MQPLRVKSVTGYAEKRASKAKWLLKGEERRCCSAERSKKLTLMVKRAACGCLKNRTGSGREGRRCASGNELAEKVTEQWRRRREETRLDEREMEGGQKEDGRER